MSFVSGFLNTLQKLAGRPSQPSEPATRSREREIAGLYWTSEDGASHHERVEIFSTATKGMSEIVTSQALPVGLEVHIARGNSAPIPAEVELCSETATGYRLGVRTVQPERRRFERQAVNLEATLDWSSSSGSKKVEKVVVRNLSPGGVQVELGRPVPVQSLVRLSRGDLLQLGFICYCNAAGDKYRVGVQFIQEAYHKDAGRSGDSR